jgi:hypothetical protein
MGESPIGLAGPSRPRRLGLTRTIRSVGQTWPTTTSTLLSLASSRRLWRRSRRRPPAPVAPAATTSLHWTAASWSTLSCRLLRPAPPLHAEPTPSTARVSTRCRRRFWRCSGAAPTPPVRSPLDADAVASRSLSRRGSARVVPWHPRAATVADRCHLLATPPPTPSELLFSLTPSGLLLSLSHPLVLSDAWCGHWPMLVMPCLWYLC